MKNNIILNMVLILMFILISDCINAANVSKEINPNVFLELRVSKTNYIVGEYITAQIALINKGDTDVSFEKGTNIGIEIVTDYGIRAPLCAIMGVKGSCSRADITMIKSNEIIRTYNTSLYKLFIHKKYMEKTTTFRLWAFLKNDTAKIETDPVEITITPPSTEIDKEAFKYVMCASKEQRKKYEEVNHVPMKCPDAVTPLMVYEGYNNIEVVEDYPKSTFAKYVLFNNALNKLYPSRQAPKKDCYLEKASEYFEKLLREYPDFELTDETMYYLAVAYYYDDEKDKSKELLQKLMAQYPDSEGAEMAQRFIKDPSVGKKRDVL